MKTEQKQSKQFSDSKETLAAGMFYTFVILTGCAFLLRVFGLEWFSATVEIDEPIPIVQEIIKALLKAFELTFVYKVLTRKGFVFCIFVSVLQSFAVGFVSVGMYQSLADAIIMFSVPILFRKDKLWSVVDTIFLYALMCLYGSLSLIGKFGELNSTQVYSFYEAILCMIDYKMFIVTVYAFVNYKGGIRLWKTKRKLLEQKIPTDPNPTAGDPTVAHSSSSVTTTLPNTTWTR